MTTRNEFIDNLRGLAILVMIVTHTTAFFPHDPIAYPIWNWSHFSVPSFLFCSIYLFLAKSSHKPFSFLTYIKKRFPRLLIPYYIFFCFFLLTLFLVSPHVITGKYVWQSIFLIGGVDINWLVLLFLYITILLPFFDWTVKKAKWLFWLYGIFSFGSAIVLMFYPLALSYKYFMWLPWSVMFYITLVYLKYEKQKKIFGLFFIIFLATFLTAYTTQSILHHSLVLINNKYPPNIFYLSYGISLLFLLSLMQQYLFENKFIFKTLQFFSKYSYSIFFIHYCLLTFFAAFISKWHLHWWSFFFLVLATTWILQQSFNSLKAKLIDKKS